MVTFRKDLDPLVRRCEAEILRIAGQKVPGVTLQRIGPIDTGGANSGNPGWSCWLVTATDAEKELLASDAALLAELQKTAAEVGFAPDCIAVQSQETVNRDFEGSWFYAMR